MSRIFYCDPCGEDRGWPRQMVPVEGLCGFCGERKLGNHTPISTLPKPAKHPNQLRFVFKEA